MPTIVHRLFPSFVWLFNIRIAGDDSICLYGGEGLAPGEFRSLFRRPWLIILIYLQRNDNSGGTNALNRPPPRTSCSKSFKVIIIDNNIIIILYYILDDCRAPFSRRSLQHLYKVILIYYYIIVADYIILLYDLLKQYHSISRLLYTRAHIYIYTGWCPAKIYPFRYR